MSDVENRIQAWAGTGESLELPDWEQLPSIPLYMDQVIFYLKDSLRFFQRDEDSSLLTSSMINNYVKKEVIPHPEKKKYGREHLGALTVVCMLKQVLSIQDLKTLLDGRELGPELYRLFREVHTEAVQETCRALEESCGQGGDLRAEALRLAARANALRAAAERILCELAREEEKTGKN